MEAEFLQTQSYGAQAIQENRGSKTMPLNLVKTSFLGIQTAIQKLYVLVDSLTIFAF